MAPSAPKVNSQQGSAANRINDLFKTAEDWRKAAVKYRPKLRLGTLTLPGSSDAAYGDQTKEGRRRLGCPVGLLLSSLRRPCHLLQWSSKFTRKTLGSSVMRVNFGEMMGHADLPGQPFSPFMGMEPGTVGVEVRETQDGGARES